MATKIVNAISTGVDLWAENEHKKGHLLGLKVDNKDSNPQTIRLMDEFTTDAGYTSGGSAYSAESLISGSAIQKFQVTVPAGDSISLGEEDCKGIEFLGRTRALGSVTASGCIITAQYKLN
ncbi:hypothetical protein ES703_92421 [subsurface metagenome]